MHALAAQGPLQIVVRIDIVFLLDVVDGHLELLGDVQVVRFGHLQEQRIRDHGVQELGFELLDGFLLLFTLELGLDPGQLLIVFFFELGQGDDLVVDDGHDFFDDLLGGGPDGADGQQDQNQAVSFYGHNDSFL